GRKRARLRADAIVRCGRTGVDGAARIGATRAASRVCQSFESKDADPEGTRSKEAQFQIGRKGRVERTPGKKTQLPQYGSEQAAQARRFLPRPAATVSRRCGRPVRGLAVHAARVGRTAGPERRQPPLRWLRRLVRAGVLALRL